MFRSWILSAANLGTDLTLIELATETCPRADVLLVTWSLAYLSKAHPTMILIVKYVIYQMENAHKRDALVSAVKCDRCARLT